jgi:CheY-like chemotaxis protein
MRVLLVEDDPGDVVMIQEGFTEALPGRLDVVGDGDAALAFLHRGPPYADAPRPDLVLLDLNLPRRDGREVLAAIKTDNALEHIPVIVPDHLRLRRRRAEQLSIARQRLRHETGHRRHLHRGDQADRALLRQRRPPAAGFRVTAA